MLRKILYLVAGILVLGAGVLFYINFIFLPTQFKTIVISQAEKTLKRKVSLGQIEYRLVSGFTLHDLTVFQKNDPQTPLLQVKEVSFKVIFPEILRNKKVIIPSLTVKSPTLNILRDQNKEWNFQDLITRPKEESQKSVSSFIVGGLTIENAKVNYHDESGDSDHVFELDNTNVKAILALPVKVKFNVDTSLPKNSATLSAQGDYDIPSKTVSSSVTTENINVAEYLPLYYQSKKFELQSGRIESAKINIKVQDKKVEIFGNLSSPDVHLILPNGRIIKGALSAAGTSVNISPQKVSVRSQNLQFTSADITLSEDFHLTGDIMAIQAGFERQDKTISFNGNLEARKANLVYKETALTGNINLTDVRFKKEKNNLQAQGELKIADADIASGPDTRIKGNVSATVKKMVLTDETLEIDGDVQVTDSDIRLAGGKTLTGHVGTKDTVFKKDKETLYAKTAFQLTQGHIEIAPDKEFTGNLSSPETSFTKKGDNLSVTTKLDLSQPIVKIDKDKSFKGGDPTVTLSLSYNPSNEPKMDYAGSIKMNGAEILGLPYLSEISKATGLIGFGTNQLKFQSFQFTSLDTDIFLSGTIENFADPQLDLTLKSERLNLATLNHLPQLKKLEMVLTGKTDADLKFKGKLSQLAEAEIRLNAGLKEASFQTPKLPAKITGLNGTLEIGSDEARWDNLKGIYGESPFTLSGQLKNFAKPVITTTLESTDLKLAAQINLLNEAFQITMLEGQYRQNTFDIKGDAHIVEGTPDFDLRGALKLDLSDLSLLLPAAKEKLETIKPAGIIEATGSFNGKFSDWRGSKINLSALCPQLSIYGYQLQNVSLDVDQKDRLLNLFKLSGIVYDGNLNITGTGDLSRDDSPVKVEASVINADLGKLREDLPSLKEKRLYGLLTASATINGPLLKTAQWQGLGAIAVRDGHLLELNFLKGIWRALLIEEFQDIVFTDGQANFTIKDNRAYTEDLALNSKNVQLFGKGWLDFNKHMNLDVNLKFSETALLQSKSPFLKSPTAILTQAGDLISVNVNGPMSNPSVSLVKTPSKILEKATGTIIEGAGAILDEIFQ